MDRMNGNNSYDQRIILNYEPYLSPYGRKVLSALVNLKKERKTNNFKPTLYPSTSQSQSSYQNKKVINFNKDTPKVRSTLNDVATEICNSSVISSHFNFQNQSSTNFPSVVTSSNNLLNVPFNDKLCEPTENVCYTNVPNYNDANMIVITNEKATTEENKTSDDISWDDMFDTDMLGIDDEVNSEISKNKHDKHHVLERVDKNKTSKPENKKIRQIDTETNKRITNNSNTNVKKEKTIIVSKNKEKVSIRKEKYTTTVKNWLNDNIGTANISHKEYIIKDDQHDQKTDNSVKINKAKKQNNIELEMGEPVNKKNSNKRTVQAQLANKDGVMKYKKPKIAVEDQTNTALNIGTSVDSNNNKTIGKVKNPYVSTKTKPIKEAKISKENKAKPKFVVPIKSQLPVKDVSYNVVIINDLINIGAVFNDLEKIALSEGVMTLVYSNGFNQLNRQHTDDTCSPEGVMFCFQDTFYYIEGLVHGIKDGLCRILSSNSIISFDAKSIVVYLMCQYDLMPNGFNIIDAKIGSSLINPDEPPENFSEMQKLLGHNAEYTIATDCTLQKAAWYMTLLRECSSNLKRLLVEQGLWKVFDDIEMKILPIVAGMESRGISVDVSKLKAMEAVLLARIKEIERQCYAAAGKVFQINSTVQVRALIYDELELDTASNVKIRETICKGAKSTSEAMLRSLITVHPLPKLILEYRHLHKAHATFLAGIAQHVCDGVVKPTWDQTAAATGRIASNNPNLQAIPKMPFNLVLFPNDDDNDKQSLNFRSVYVARAGRTLLAADFKHIECRVFAHAAADSGLLSALESPDLFRVLAAKWLNKSECSVSAEDRERTKRIVYASLYGAGTRKLADILDLGYEQVLSIMTSFNRTFPSLKSFGRSVVAQCCRQRGRLSTASGRARTFHSITSSDFQAKSHAERQAVNFIIQGSAADLCKMAMVVSTERLQGRAQAQLLLQIHDELVWEVPDQYLHVAAGIIKNAMEGCGQVFGMPQTLPVAMYRGCNWGEMEEFTPTSCLIFE